jgi:hypothetical protein
VATEYLVGEEALDRWIGYIATNAMLPRGGKRVSISELPDAVKAVVRSIRQELPEAPYCRLEPPEGGGGILARPPGEPDEQGDYPDCDDVQTGNSSFPELWIALHSALFDSGRYSRCGERFAYVKIDGAEWEGHQNVFMRGEIEDRLDEVLRPAGLGCPVGGAGGLRYSYVDLALAKVREGARAARDALRELDLPSRSWILFHDRDLAAEWIGVQPDSPPPPRRSDAA